MLKRKIEDALIAWKNKPGHKPLVIMGIRQCGIQGYFEGVPRRYGQVCSGQRQAPYPRVLQFHPQAAGQGEQEIPIQ